MENNQKNLMDMQEIENSPFVIKGAIRRLYFFINSMFLSLAAALFMRMASALSNSMESGIFTSLISMIAVLFSLFCIGLYLVNIKKRVADIRGFVDWPAVILACVLNLIPYVNLLLIVLLSLIPSHKSHNITYHTV